MHVVDSGREYVRPRLSVCAFAFAPPIQIRAWWAGTMDLSIRELHSKRGWKYPSRQRGREGVRCAGVTKGRESAIAGVDADDSRDADNQIGGRTRGGSADARKTQDRASWTSVATQTGRRGG